MPHKNNANGRHHRPKMRHCAANWREYDAGLRRRASLTLWVTGEAMAAWAAAPGASPGCQAAQRTEAVVGVAVLNRRLGTVWPNAVRRSVTSASVGSATAAPLRRRTAHQRPRVC